MKNNELDKLFKEKVESSEKNSFLPSDWNSFSELLSKEEGFNGLNFDDKIKNKVSGHKAKYNSDHWELLRQRLLKEDKIKRILFNSKFAEMSAIFACLLLFQLFNLGFSKKNTLEKIKITTPVKKEGYAKVTSRNKTYILSEDEKITTISEASSKEKTIDNNTIIGFEISQLSTTSSNLRSEGEIVNNIEQSTNVSSMLNTNSSSSIVLEKQSSNTLQDQVPNLIGKQTTELTSNHQLSETSKANEITNFIASESIHDLADLPKITSEKLESYPDFEPIGSKVNLQSSFTLKPRHFIQPQIHYGQSQIISSYDDVYSLSSSSSTSRNYGIGLLYSFLKNNVELQTGLRYTNRNYTPRKVSEIYQPINAETYIISLNKISLSTVDLPMNMKIFFGNRKNSSFFGKLGANFNLNLKNKYYVTDDEFNPSPNKTSFTDRSIVLTGDERLSPSSKLSEKDFTSGILDRGGFFENSFVTVSAEVGYEKMISAKTRIVTGLEYNKFFTIEGIGPNKDKLNSININLGLKYEIN
jgi:uncharacterized protein YdcH (DUF465 family)